MGKRKCNSNVIWFSRLSVETKNPAMRKNRIKLYFLCNNKIFFLNEANSVTQVTSVTAKCSFEIGIRYHIRHKTWTHNFKIVFFCYPETEEFRYSRKGRKAYEFLGCQIAIFVQLLNSNQAVFANFHQPLSQGGSLGSWKRLN